jgi:hypothetical protein
MMDEFAEVDLLIQVSTVAVILVSALIIVVLYRFERVLEQVERIVERIATETVRIGHDLTDLRNGVRETIGLIKPLLNLFAKFTKRTSSKS